ncbi:excinuclease ABC subunit UvrA [bacterium]|nr:excinuclease ABC subunit UvrA [bacterium]
MAFRSIRVFGASEHNLRHIDVEIPRHSLTVITGLSGSGKSSLAFDTLYAEGQRRYVESLSAYARQFLEQLPKPKVDKIEGLSPAISIDQKTVNRNPRSTVGTVTEIYDYLRLLYSSVGHAHCPKCSRKLIRQTSEDITELVMALPERCRIMVMAPVIRGRKGEYQALFQKYLKQGFVRAKIDGELVDLDPSLKLRKQFKHDIAIVVDRLVITPEVRPRLEQAIKTALSKAEQFVSIEILPGSDGTFPDGVPWKGERTFTEEVGCPVHGPQIVEMAPRVFSFNSRYGACPECDGLGTIAEVDEDRLVPEKGLSLGQGAVGPWRGYFKRGGGRNKTLIESSGHAMQLMQVLSDFEIADETPWNELSDLQREVLLYGFRRPISPTNPKAKKARKRTDTTSWRGVVGRIQKKMEEADDEDEYAALSGYLRPTPCPSCNGARLRRESLAVTFREKNIADVTRMDIGAALEFFRGIKLTGRDAVIANEPLREIVDRLEYLYNVGLHYLNLDRGASTLSGGEAQRIRLATQIGSKLTGVMYILDEPSIGLHQRDNEKLLRTLTAIRDRGNTVLVVEHDEQTIREADYVVDLGPGAGMRGGELIAAGVPAEVERSERSVTAQYLRGERRIAVPSERRSPTDRRLVIEGASLHSLKDVTLELPAGLLVGVTGVSGSGKSSLVMETLLPLVMNHCYKASHQVVGPHRAVRGLEHFDRCINVDQSPIGRTPRSNPATYTKVFDAIRDVFEKTTDARTRGYTKGRFSFNTKGGRCEECGGQGSVKVEMNFLPDVYVKCETCDGRRYNSETLAVRYKGHSVADVLEMTVEEACGVFESIPPVATVLRTLNDVGLGYIHLGQSATTLSGGEAQRMKLARELAKRNTGKSLYILDEPTTGLHFADVHQLLDVMNRLVDAGSTVVVIEHHLDIIKCCDWIVDMGPEGGSAGGQIIAAGPPEVVAGTPGSETGRFLREVLPAPPTKQKKR